MSCSAQRFTNSNIRISNSSELVTNQDEVFFLFFSPKVFHELWTHEVQWAVFQDKKIEP